MTAVVTQCSMRHLYIAKDEPGVSYLIDKAKTYERRRCGHHPEDFPEPLSEQECISSVVDPKGSKHNKNRYVVASQDLEVRKSMRTVLGVPLVYINRSVSLNVPKNNSLFWHVSGVYGSEALRSNALSRHASALSKHLKNTKNSRLTPRS